MHRGSDRKTLLVQLLPLLEIFQESGEVLSLFVCIGQFQKLVEDDVASVRSNVDGGHGEVLRDLPGRSQICHFQNNSFNDLIKN